MGNGSPKAQSKGGVKRVPQRRTSLSILFFRRRPFCLGQAASRLPPRSDGDGEGGSSGEEDQGGGGGGGGEAAEAVEAAGAASGHLVVPGAVYGRLLGLFEDRAVRRAVAKKRWVALPPPNFAGEGGGGGGGEKPPVAAAAAAAGGGGGGRGGGGGGGGGAARAAAGAATGGGDGAGPAAVAAAEARALRAAGRAYATRLALFMAKCVPRATCLLFPIREASMHGSVPVFQVHPKAMAESGLLPLDLAALSLLSSPPLPQARRDGAGSARAPPACHLLAPPPRQPAPTPAGNPPSPRAAAARRRTVPPTCKEGPPTTPTDAPAPFLCCPLPCLKANDTPPPSSSR